VFYSLVAGFSLGVLISSFIKLGFSIGAFILILATAIYFFGRFLTEDENKTRIILISIFLLALSLGILRYEIKDFKSLDDPISQFVGQKIILTGTVASEPGLKENSVDLVIEVNKIDEIEVEGKVLVSTNFFPVANYGDLVQVQGKLEVPENFTTDNGSAFDYIGFLAKDDIFYKVSFAQTKIISAGHGNFIRTQLFALKNLFIKKINALIKEPESSLLAGLLLGAKNSLGSDLQTDFQKAGVSHIVALSGYNITIVAEGIMASLSFLPRFGAIGAGALGIFLFAIMTGGSATVMRASIMALLVLLAKATGRLYDVTRALLLAGFFMILHNPKILVFDISFQLSFLSTLALILVSPILEKRFSFITPKYKFKELILATISTQIFVLPFIFYKFGLVSLVALPANVLILPIIPFVMLTGFLTGMTALVSNILAWPFALISSLCLSYILKIINWSANFPYSSFNLKNFPLSLVLIIYFIFLIVIWRSRKISPPLSNLN